MAASREDDLLQDGEDVGELLIPPDLAAEHVRPLAGGRTVHLGGETMGTLWSLSTVLPSTIRPDDLSAAMQRCFALVISQMSQWEPTSELSRFNRTEAGTHFAVSRQFAIVLDCALQIARASGGAFDPTLGSANELWGFGHSGPPTSVPDAGAAQTARTHGWQDVAFDLPRRLIVQPGGLQLDLSGIAKGFAVDLALHMLQSLGVHHALVEIGGELRGIGVRADGLPWWVDLDVPPGSNAPLARIGLSGWAVATSGNYRRRREAEGRSWSHSLDPATGRPIEDEILAVSVLHPGCMQADALATAIIVLGPESGMAFADANAIPARAITPAGAATSAAWKRWLS